MVKSTSLLFQKNLVRFLAPTWWPTTVCNSSSSGSDALSGLLSALGMQEVHKHTDRQNIHTHIK